VRQRLVFLTVASLGAVLLMALVYFSAGAAAPVSLNSLSPGDPAHNPPQGHIASTGKANPEGLATATPTVCAGGPPGTWAVRAPLPIDAFGVAVASDGTYAYAFGGYSFSVPGAINQVSRYDPVADTWASRASIAVVTYDAVAVYGNNGNIYVFGGTDAANVYNTTRIYNTGSDTWSTGTAMPGNRQQMGAGYYNGKIYIVGGFDTTSVSPQSQTWEYDIASNTWATKASMPQALGGPGSGVIRSHLYLAGGRDSTNVARNILYDYDIAADSWGVRANLPMGVNSPGSGVIPGRLVAIFGGGNPFLTRTKDEVKPQYPANAGPFTTGSTQLYDPVTNTWSPVSNLNVARSLIGGATVGQYLVAIGGYNGTTSVNTNEVSGAGACGTSTPTPPTNTPTSTNTPPSVTNTPTSTPTPPTNTPTSTNTPPSATNTPSNTPSNTPTAFTPTPGTPPPTYTATPTPDVTPPSATTSPTIGLPTLTPTICPILFTDVPEGSTFYAYIRCLACRGIVSGYSTSPPCTTGTPCFQPGDNVTRGQMAKFVSNSAGYSDPIPPTQQTFTDVPPTSPFWIYIERVYAHHVAGGYTTSPPCTTGTPCFLPGNSVTRGQTAKFVSNAANFEDPIPPGQQTFTDVPNTQTFWMYIERVYMHNVIGGYTTSPPCTTGTPCYLAGNSATRGQMSKFVSNAFFVDCDTPSR
jgi:hypothetical protein